MTLDTIPDNDLHGRRDELLKAQREVGHALAVTEVLLLCRQYHEGLLSSTDLVRAVFRVTSSTHPLREGDTDLITETVFEDDDGESFLKRVENAFAVSRASDDLDDLESNRQPRSLRQEMVEEELAAEIEEADDLQAMSLDGTLKHGWTYDNRQGIPVQVKWCADANYLGAPFCGNNGLFYHADGVEATGSTASDLVRVSQKGDGDQALPESVRSALVDGRLQTTAEQVPEKWVAHAERVPNVDFLVDGQKYQLMNNRMITLHQTPEDKDGFSFYGEGIRFTARGRAEGDDRELDVFRAAIFDVTNIDLRAVDERDYKALPGAYWCVPESGKDQAAVIAEQTTRKAVSDPPKGLFIGELKEGVSYALANERVTSFTQTTDHSGKVVFRAEGGDLYLPNGCVYMYCTDPDKADQPEYVMVTERPNHLDVKYAAGPALLVGRWYLACSGQLVYIDHVRLIDGLDSVAEQYGATINGRDVVYDKMGMPLSESGPDDQLLRILNDWEVPLKDGLPPFKGPLVDGGRYRLNNGDFVTMRAIGPAGQIRFESSLGLLYRESGQWSHKETIDGAAHDLMCVRCAAEVHTSAGKPMHLDEDDGAV